jgi:hypothetical protein
MPCRSGPIFGPELTKPFDEPVPIVLETAQSTVEIDVE